MSRRWADRAVTWGGGVIAAWVLGLMGMHPVGAAVAGIAVALLIAAVLSWPPL